MNNKMNTPGKTTMIETINRVPLLKLPGGQVIEVSVNGTIDRAQAEEIIQLQEALEVSCIKHACKKAQSEISVADREKVIETVIKINFEEEEDHSDTTILTIRPQEYKYIQFEVLEKITKAGFGPWFRHPSNFQDSMNKQTLSTTASIPTFKNTFFKLTEYKDGNPMLSKEHVKKFLKLLFLPSAQALLEWEDIPGTKLYGMLDGRPVYSDGKGNFHRVTPIDNYVAKKKRGWSNMYKKVPESSHKSIGNLPENREDILEKLCLSGTVEFDNKVDALLNYVSTKNPFSMDMVLREVTIDKKKDAAPVDYDTLERSELRKLASQLNLKDYGVNGNSSTQDIRAALKKRDAKKQ